MTHREKELLEALTESVRRIELLARYASNASERRGFEQSIRIIESEMNAIESEAVRALLARMMR